MIYILVNDEGMTDDSHQLALVQTSPIGQTLTTSEVATGSGLGQGQLTQPSVMTGQALSHRLTAALIDYANRQPR